MTPRQDGVSPGICFPPQPKTSFEQSKKEVQRPAAPGPPAEGLLQSRQEPETEKQAALNKGTALGPAGPTPAGTLCLLGAPSILLGSCPCSPGGVQPGVSVCSAVGIVPPRTKSPAEEEAVPTVGVPRRSAGGMANGLSSRVGLVFWGWGGGAGLAKWGAGAACRGAHCCVAPHLSIQLLGTPWAISVPFPHPGNRLNTTARCRGMQLWADRAGPCCRQGCVTLGLGSPQERPKSAVFANETKVKMSVEEQIDRMKRHQSGSVKEKRRSLQLPSSQQPDTPGTKAPTSYKVVSPCTGRGAGANWPLLCRVPEVPDGAEGTLGAVEGDSVPSRGGSAELGSLAGAPAPQHP